MLKKIKACILSMALAGHIYYQGAAQKILLDHSVYDEWQSIDEKLISSEGTLVIYTIVPQEGPGELIIQKASGERLLVIPRGYSAILSNDGQFLVCRVKAQLTKQKKASSQNPGQTLKDSLVIVHLKTLKREIYPDLVSLSYSKRSEWIAWVSSDSSIFVDTSNRNTNSQLGMLNIKNLTTAEVFTIPRTVEILFDKTGQHLVFERKQLTPLQLFSVYVFDCASKRIDTVRQDLLDSKGYAFSDDGSRLAFYIKNKVDSNKNVIPYQLLYYETAANRSEVLNLDSVAMWKNYKLNESFPLSFVSHRPTQVVSQVFSSFGAAVRGYCW